MGSGGCDVLLWRKPATALLVLTIGTLVYAHCHFMQRSAPALVGEALLVLACAGGALGFLAQHLNFQAPLDPLKYKLSAEMAQQIVAGLANVLGAANGVLRVAASGSDYRLFAKVVTFLYFLAALGRACSGPTVAYLGLWFLFTVPFLCANLYPERAEECPKFFRVRSPRRGRLTALKKRNNKMLVDTQVQR